MSALAGFACDIVVSSQKQETARMDAPPGEVTILLQFWGSGDRSVEPQLFELVLPDLKKLARGIMRGERPGHTLQPTALLNEAYFRLVAARERDWHNRRHFFAFAARVMRRLLVDHARRRPTAQFVPVEELDDWLRASTGRIAQAAEIDELLNQAHDLDPDWSTLVELKFYLGFTDEEAADALHMPLRTLQRKFGDARRWLFEKLEPGSCQDLVPRKN
jgi:RNA polymerase sigma factor (TIGR02999 family)